MQRHRRAFSQAHLDAEGIAVSDELGDHQTLGCFSVTVPCPIDFPIRGR